MVAFTYCLSCDATRLSRLWQAVWWQLTVYINQPSLRQDMIWQPAVQSTSQTIWDLHVACLCRSLVTKQFHAAKKSGELTSISSACSGASDVVLSTNPKRGLLH